MLPTSAMATSRSTQSFSHPATLSNSPISRTHTISQRKMLRIRHPSKQGASGSQGQNGQSKTQFPSRRSKKKICYGLVARKLMSTSHHKNTMMTKMQLGSVMNVIFGPVESSSSSYSQVYFPSQDKVENSSSTRFALPLSPSLLCSKHDRRCKMI